MKKPVILAFLLAFISVLPFAAFAQNEVQLSPQEKKKMNTFFSNFSEADVKSFSPETLSDTAMLNFALMHNYKNNFKSLQKSKDNLSVVIPSSLVDKTTKKYFGRKVSVHQSKTYTVPMADGEAYAFSQIRKLTRMKDDTFEARGVVFSAGSGFTGNPHGNLSEWKKEGEIPDPIGEFVAIIKKSPTDKDRFVLIRYSLSDKGPAKR